MNGETPENHFLNLARGKFFPPPPFLSMFVILTGRYITLLCFICLVPRSGPRNLRVFGETTNSLSVAWDHADGPVQQYRIIYSPTVGDPIDEYVSLTLVYLSIL